MKVKAGRILFILLTITILNNLGCCFGSEIQINEGIVVPAFPDAKDLWGGAYNVAINGIPTKMLCFSSNSSLRQILEFYKQELPKYGWQFGNAWEDLQVAYFTKGGNFLYVAASGAIRGYDLSLTKFVLVLSKGELHLCATINLIRGPNFKEVEGKDLPFIPRYPGAVRVLNINREDKEVFFIYVVREDAHKIADFYRKNLSAFGWRLAKRLSMPRSCIQETFSASSLIFERGKKDSLAIYISYCTESQANVIIIAYNYAFNYAIWPIGVDQTW